jgi:hypothetical protein
MPAKSRSCSCGNPISARTAGRTGLCVTCYKAAAQTRPVSVPAVPVAPVAPKAPPVPAEQVKADRQLRQAQADLADVRAKYKSALSTIELQDSQLNIMAAIREGVDTTIKIEPSHGSGTSEATPVLLASDWHAEENITKAQTNGLNESNLELADAKITKFWQSGLRLIKLLNKDVTINNVVLGLLGDFITGHLHEESVENVALGPTEAIVWVQNRIIAGLQFMLDNSSYTYTVVCRVGNHSRTTKKVHFSVENHHSLEHLMYVHLKGYFRSEPRLNFVIQDGYHAYVDIYDTTVRFHHGHAIKYGGGVGGLFIPTYKKISQWQKGRHASLDCFGHFHQMKDGGNFLCNGSLVGYNSYALSIGADFEQPKQTLFLVDKRRGRTCTWPVLLS